MNEIFLITTDNVKVAINYYNHSNDEVIIVCPGWFMTKDSAIFRTMSEDFAKTFDVISMDFRGHGRSGGFYTFTSNEEKDLDIVVNFARERYKKVFLCGFSLGGALVLLYSAKNKNIDKVIAISAPADFMKIENNIFSPDAWIPTLFYKFELFRWLSIRPGVPWLKKDKPINFVENIKVPTLFIAGEKDPTVFPWHTKLLYDKALCEKDYKLFENARHAEDLYYDFPRDFINICVNWFKS